MPEFVESELLERVAFGLVVCRVGDPAVSDSLRIVWANRAAADALAFELPLVEAGRAALAGLSASSRARLLAATRSTRELTGAIAEIEFNGRGCALIRLAGGAVAIAVDPELARLADEQNQRFDSFMHEVLEHVPAMVFVKQASDLRFVHFNRAGEELLGVAREALIGKSDRDLFPAEQAAFFNAKDREVLAGAKVVEIAEEPIDTPLGQRWLHTHKIPLLDANGVPTHLVGVSIDITERRAAAAALLDSQIRLSRTVEERTLALERAQRALESTEDQLRQAQKMEAIGRLAGGIAHDFNNLLTAILSHTELTIEAMAVEDPLRADLELVREAGKRAATLTRQLLAFSRRQVLQMRVLDVNEVIATMEGMLPRLLGEDVDLSIRRAHGLRRIKADRSQLEQVVMNLAINARDAMPEGGRLSIETANVSLDEDYAAAHVGSSVGPHVMVAVSDTGIGMDKAVRERIFEPFFTTKAEGRGTGLGLATVFGIVKQSGGSIWVYSEPGRGATFKIYFPATSDHVTVELPRASGTLDGRETILLVEDDDGVRRVATEMLRRRGYQVFAVRGGAEALSLVEGLAALDLLLTDVVMPNMGGRALAERVLAARPGTRVLFMSGYTDDAIVRHGVLESEMEFVQKPLTPESLARRVREVLDAKR
jgi:two-component system, cell cycle sensor histidine kinase and response regulator CckA